MPWFCSAGSIIISIIQEFLLRLLETEHPASRKSRGEEKLLSKTLSVQFVKFLLLGSDSERED